MKDYLIKQDSTKPYFADLAWSKPENKQHAGKLLIISGDTTGFAVAAQSFMVANKTGAGATRVLLPDNNKRLVPKELYLEISFAPSVKMGSFSKGALAEMLEQSYWADAVILPGGTGRNSESTTTIESFTTKYSGLLIVAKDALDIFVTHPQELLGRERTIVCADFSQLQKILSKVPKIQPPMFSMNASQLVEILHLATTEVKATIITKHQDIVYVSHGGRVSTTENTDAIWRVDTATKASVWAMQHPSKLFEAATTAVVGLAE
jgi:NAD(P)H-hydrate repair Nnr-like enzyme with NAD(P)H-hydrate dehydratase domain